MCTPFMPLILLRVLPVSHSGVGGKELFNYGVNCRYMLVGFMTRPISAQVSPSDTFWW